MKAALLPSLLVLALLSGCDGDGAVDAGAPDAGVDASAADAGDPTRMVTLEISPTVVPELPETDLLFTLTLDAPPPPGGTRVYVRGDVPQSLTQLDLFAIRTRPAANDAPVGDLDFSGFTLLLESESVIVEVPSFDDMMAEDPVDVTFRIVPFDEVPWGETAIEGEPSAGPYTVSGAPVTVTLQDAP